MRDFESVKMKQFNWEYSFGVALLVTVVAFLAIMGVLAFAPKNVDYYYYSKASARDGNVCVYAHWTWHADEIAFCSDDYSRAQDFLLKANQTIVKKP